MYLNSSLGGSSTETKFPVFCEREINYISKLSLGAVFWF